MPDGTSVGDVENAAPNDGHIPSDGGGRQGYPSGSADALARWGMAALGRQRPDSSYDNRPTTAGPDTTMSVLQQILDRLNGTGGDGPNLIGGPDRGAYMRPYDEAERRANESYGRAVPELANLYKGLEGEIASGNRDFTGQVDRLQAEREGQMSQRMADLRAAAGPSQAALVEGGEAATGATSQLAAQEEALNAAYDAERGRNQRLDQVDAQAATARDADVDTAATNSSANARNNLDSILQQVGIGRADAESQYQRDARSVAEHNASAKDAYADEQRAQGEQDLQNWITMNTGLAEAATTSRRSMFESAVGELSSAYPRQYSAFNDIIGSAKGKGAMGKASALKILEQALPGLKDGSMYGARFNDSRLRQWIDAYYDEDEQIDKGRYQEMGGDPAALGFLEGGISNPQLMQLLMMQGGRR
jgi:hypothetical protein